MTVYTYTSKQIITNRALLIFLNFSAIFAVLGILNIERVHKWSNDYSGWLQCHHFYIKMSISGMITVELIEYLTKSFI